jgi:hypothetical protein
MASSLAVNHGDAAPGKCQAPQRHIAACGLPDRRESATAAEQPTLRITGVNAALTPPSHSSRS